MAIRVEFHDKKFFQEFERATATGLVRAGQFYHTVVRRKVAKPNSGRRRVRTRDTSRGPKGSQYTVYPTPSEPGEPPRLRTGYGMRNIVFWFSGWKTTPVVRVGVAKNAFYMFWLEVGTETVARRPFLLTTLMELRDTLGKLAMFQAKRRMP